MENFRRGADPGIGKEVEVHLLALLGLRLFELVWDNKEFKKFKLGFNVKDYGMFDDFVILLKKNSGLCQKVVVQVKTKQNNVLALDSLNAAEGKFSLEKYAKSGIKIKDVTYYILYTNCKLNKPHNGFKVSNDIAELKFLDTSQSTAGHIFKYTTSSNYADFFEKFFLYTEQENLNELKEEILLTIQKFAGNAESKNEYINLCFALHNNDRIENIVSHKNELDLERTGMLLVVSLLKQFQVIVDPRNNEHKKQWTIFCKSVESFTVTVINSEMLSNWITGNSEDYSAWSSKEDPVIIKINNNENATQVEKAITIFNKLNSKQNKEKNNYQYKNVIVCGKLNNLTDEIKAFQNLSCVKPDVKELLETFSLSLDFPSKLLQKNYDALLHIITPTILFDCLNNSKDNKKEDIPENYICRTIEAPILYDISTVTEEIENHYFIIVTDKFEVQDVNQFLIQYWNSHVNIFQKQKQPNFMKNLLVMKTSNTTSYATILEKYKSKQNIVMFKLILKLEDILEDVQLEWILSSGPKTKLLKNPSFKCVPAVLPIASNKICILCADPGMGKTTLLKQLHNEQISNNHYSKFIQIHKHTKFLKKINSDTASESIFKSYVNISTNTCDKDILTEFCSTKRQRYLFLDGFDELDSQYLSNAILSVKKLLTLPIDQIWISSRNHLKHQLEEEFQIHAMKITKIDQHDQKKYIKNRLQATINEDKINSIIDDLYSNFNLQVFQQNSDILGVPLQLYVITEVLIDNNDENDFTKLLILSQLYETFFQGKLKHLQDKNLENNQNINKRYDLDHYEILALKLCLDENDFQNLNVHNYDQCVDNVKYSLCAGIITNLDYEKIASFEHYSFAEYFCARYFVKQFKKIQNCENIYFNPKYKAIRFLINMKLCEHSQFHLDIIYLNFDSIRKLNNNKNANDLKDNGGRNLLQLAVSRGENYSNHISNDLNTTYVKIIVNDNLLAIIRNLLHKKIFNLNEKDDLLQLNCFEYAQKLNDFSIIDILLPSSITLKKFCLKQKQSVLWYSVTNNFLNLLSLCLDDLKFVKNTHFEYKDNLGTRKGYAIHVATQTQQLDCLKLLLKRGIDINCLTTNGFTPLHIAAHQGYVNCLKVLISNGALINFKSSYNVTALHGAAHQGHLNCLQLLIDSGADINFQNDNNATALHDAAFNGHLDCLKALINSGANINVKNKEMLTPLHNAAHQGHLNCLEALIDAGADINAKNANGSSILHDVAYYGNFNCLKILIDRNVDVKSKSWDGVTALHGAAHEGHLLSLELLIEHGAEVNYQNDYGSSPLHDAAFGGHVNCVEALIRKGANVNLKGNDNLTPLHYAATQGHFSCVEVLVRANADVNSKSSNGVSILQDVANFGYVDCLKVLLTNNANVNSKCSNNNTALHAAADKGHLYCLTLLISFNADVNFQNNMGFTPLHCAALSGHLNCIKVLIESNADINLEANDGSTAYHCAIKRGHSSCYEVLAGTDVTWRTSLYTFRCHVENVFRLTFVYLRQRWRRK